VIRSVPGEDCFIDRFESRGPRPNRPSEGSNSNGAKIGTNDRTAQAPPLQVGQSLDRTAQAPPLQVGQSLVFVGAMLASSHTPRAASRNQTTKPLILAPFGSNSNLSAHAGATASIPVFAAAARSSHGAQEALGSGPIRLIDSRDCIMIMLLFRPAIRLVVVNPSQLHH